MEHNNNNGPSGTEKNQKAPLFPILRFPSQPSKAVIKHSPGDALLQSLFKPELAQQKVSESTITSFEKEDLKESSSSSESEKEEKKKRKKHRKEKENKRKKYKKDKKTRTDREKEKMLEIERRWISETDRKSTIVWLTEDKLDKIFYYDVKGDPDNRLFGSLYRMDVALYYHPRFCLGLGKDEGISATKSGYSVFKFGAKDNRQQVRYSEAKNAFKERDVDEKRVHLAEHKLKVPQKLDADFIPLDKKYWDKYEASNMQLSTHLQGTTYLDSLEESEKVDEDGETVDEYLLRRTKELNQIALDQPHSIQNWFDYIKFQDEFLQLLGKSKKYTKSSIVDKKLALYEKAIDLNPNNIDLKLGMLKDAAEIWEPEKVSHMWQKFLKEHSKSWRMWTEYLNYAQSTFASFSMANMREAFQLGIQSLQSIVLSDAYKSRYANEASDIWTLESHLLQLFIRSDVFENQAGYTEKSVALYQAMIEFNLFCPNNIYTYSEQLAKFETFWDSEFPRFGDAGGNGWASWFKENSNLVGTSDAKRKKATHGHPTFMDAAPSLPEVPFPQMPAEEPATESPDSLEKKVFQDWFKDEQARECMWLPARPIQEFGMDTEYDQEDPERVVLYEDVQNYLFQFTCEDMKLQLFYSFLELLGFNLSTRLINNTNNNSFLNAMHYNLLSINNNADSLDNPFSRIYNSNSEHYHQIIEQMDEVNDLYELLMLTKKKQVLCGFEDSDTPFVHKGDKLKVQFIRNSFAQMQSIYPNDIGLLILSVFFESSVHWENALKLCKSYLKSHRTQLALWDIYAQLEKKAGNLAECERVYSTALSLHHQLPPPVNMVQKYIVFALFRNYAQLMIAQNNVPVATYILMNAVESAFTPWSENANISKTKLLKTKKLYQQKFELLQSDSRKSQNLGQVHFVICYALFEFLTTADIQNACKVFDTALSDIFQYKDSLEREQLWLAYVQFLYQYNNAMFASNNPHNVANMNNMMPLAPSKYREIVMRALSDFPYNGLLMSIFIEGEARSQIANRIRQYFDDTCEKTPSALLWLASIHAETARLGGSPRIQSLFERALQQPATRSSIVLWRFYLDYQLQRGSQNISKGIFYRAVRNIPWSKKLWLDSFAKLTGALTVNELNDVFRFMTEKEIRIRKLPE